MDGLDRAREGGARPLSPIGRRRDPARTRAAWRRGRREMEPVLHADAAQPNLIDAPGDAEHQATAKYDPGSSVVARQPDRERDGAHQYEAECPRRIQIEPAPRDEFETEVAIDEPR